MYYPIDLELDAAYNFYIQLLHGTWYSGIGFL